jgi:hypothetical protein
VKQIRGTGLAIFTPRETLLRGSLTPEGAFIARARRTSTVERNHFPTVTAWRSAVTCARAIGAATYANEVSSDLEIIDHLGLQKLVQRLRGEMLCWGHGSSSNRELSTRIDGENTTLIFHREPLMCFSGAGVASTQSAITLLARAFHQIINFGIGIHCINSVPPEANDERRNASPRA